MRTFPYNEDLLQFIWEKQLFDPRGLRTAAGEEVQVIRPGRINPGSGPDLLNADLRIGGQRWVGHVEVHVRSSECNAHGHANDPAYNNVVLHVVFVHDAEVRTSAGATLPTVELNDRMGVESLAAYQQLMDSAAWIPCAHQFHRADQSKLAVWSERLLIERLERKCLEVEALHAQLGHDPAETFWHVLARGFGFKVNAEAFGMLALSLPLKVLLKYRDDPLRLEALLFGQAGLLRTDMVDDHPRALQHEHALLAAAHALTPMPTAAWRSGRLRPPNFPTVRIAQLARLLQRIDGNFSALLDHDVPAPILHLLDLEADGYWRDHYRFDQPSAPRTKRLGADAAQLLMINALVPYHFAMGRVQGREMLKERALCLLEKLPAENNAVLQGWARLGVKVGHAAQGQALIELKDRYCGQRRCLHCVIGTDLLKRPSLNFGTP